MKKITLDTVYDYDFDLFGISISAKGYMFAAAINKHLNIQLKRVEDLEVRHPRQKEFDAYLVYHFQDLDLELDFYLIGNKSKQALIPHLKPIDYFWMIKGDYKIKDPILYTNLFKEIKGVNLAYPIKVEPKTAFVNLLF
ncbi:MAG: IPExxxVDY family protein [Bacteroidota bacterium]|nr:IPExxxVDY family protein [Bacteroidota bacterium]